MKKILFVDDEPNVLAAFQRQLRRQFEVETAPSGREGLALLQKARDYAVVVADMRMPEMNGVEFLKEVKTAAPEAVRIMLTGNADQGTAIEAINQGRIFSFLHKPCPTGKTHRSAGSGGASTSTHHGGAGASGKHAQRQRPGAGGNPGVGGA